MAFSSRPGMLDDLFYVLALPPAILTVIRQRPRACGRCRDNCGRCRKNRAGGSEESGKMPVSGKMPTSVDIGGRFAALLSRGRPML